MMMSRLFMVAVVATAVMTTTLEARFLSEFFFPTMDMTDLGLSDAHNDANDEDTKEDLSLLQKSSSVSEVMGCKWLPPMHIFKQLNAVCEDCFQLFRDQELYHMCRSDCFGSDYFIGCMNYLIFTDNHIAQMANLVNTIHE